MASFLSRLPGLASRLVLVSFRVSQHCTCQSRHPRPLCRSQTWPRCPFKTLRKLNHDLEEQTARRKVSPGVGMTSSCVCITAGVASLPHRDREDEIVKISSSYLKNGELFRDLLISQ